MNLDGWKIIDMAPLKPGHTYATSSWAHWEKPIEFRVFIMKDSSILCERPFLKFGWNFISLSKKEPPKNEGSTPGKPPPFGK